MKKTVLVSDLSETVIEDGNGATVRVSYPGDEPGRELHVTRQEADELFAGGREVKKRGRKAATATPAASGKGK